MKLWHDDIRKPPDESWTWARTNDEAIALLEYPGAEEASLDHDLGHHNVDPDADPYSYLLRGQSEQTGMDLVDWMIQHDRVPEKVTIHSWNPAGAQRMIAALQAKGHHARYAPYEPKGVFVV